MAHVQTTTGQPATFSLQRWTSSRDQRMHMGMRFQLLVPGMQHHRGRSFEALFLGDHVTQGLPGGVKQQIVNLTPIAQG